MVDITLGKVAIPYGRVHRLEVDFADFSAEALVALITHGAKQKVGDAWSTRIQNQPEPHAVLRNWARDALRGTAASPGRSVEVEFTNLVRDWLARAGVARKQFAYVTSAAAARAAVTAHIANAARSAVVLARLEAGAMKAVAAVAAARAEALADEEIAGADSDDDGGTGDYAAGACSDDDYAAGTDSDDDAAPDAAPDATPAPTA